MGQNKDIKKQGSQEAMGNKPENQGYNPSSGKGSQGQQAGGHQKNLEDDMSKKGRESSGSGQWSPGSGQQSDR